MNKRTGIILAGGQSKRMGRDKALIHYRGKVLVEYSIDLLQSYCDEIIISSNGHALDQYGYTIVKDNYPGIGPIGGLYSTLLISRHEHNLVCPCDMPHVNKAIIEKILAESGSNPAVVVQEKAGKVNPLLGYYNRSCFNALKAQIDKGNFMMQQVIEQLKAKKIMIDDHKSLMNINYLRDMNPP